MNINFSLLLTQIINVLVGVGLPTAVILVVISHYRRLRNIENRISDLEKEINKETPA